MPLGSLTQSIDAYGWPLSSPAKMSHAYVYLRGSLINHTECTVVLCRGGEGERAEHAAGRRDVRLHVPPEGGAGLQAVGAPPPRPAHHEHQGRSRRRMHFALALSKLPSGAHSELSQGSTGIQF